MLIVTASMLRLNFMSLIVWQNGCSVLKMPPISLAYYVVRMVCAVIYLRLQIKLWTIFQKFFKVWESLGVHCQVSHW